MEQANSGTPTSESRSLPVGTAWASYLVCLLAASVEAVLGCTSTAGLSPADAFILLLVIGPYFLLSVLAWCHRHRLRAARAILVVAVLCALVGLTVWAIDSYRYHTEARYRQLLRIEGFLVALAQWLVAAGLAMWLRVRRPAA